LRAKLSGYTNAVVLNGTEVVNIEQHAKNVRLLCRDITDGHEHSLNAKYLVGCDGANSLVRSTIGSDVDDLGFNERWLVVDLLLKRERPDLGDYSIQFCDPVRPMTYCRNPAKRRRWEITMLEGETHEEVTRSDTIWKFLTPWVTAEDAELERAAVYTFQSVVANNWRKDRLLIAGDAAHLTPPFMGQGMCAGIRDAANLAWKLALCIKGAANEDILDSYQQERSPHVRAFIEMAIRLGGLINTIDSRTALAQAESNAEGTARISSITPPLGASDLGELISSNRPHCGYLFSQPILRDGQRLDDKVGYCPVLILRHPLHENITPVVSVLDAEEHPNLATALDGLNTNAVLVRPDRYIAGSAIFENDIVDMAVTGLPSPISVTKEREPTL
jgi:3-(3-hydroxy-phenyl)propionate hydroxylase